MSLHPASECRICDAVDRYVAEGNLTIRRFRGSGVESTTRRSAPSHVGAGLDSTPELRERLARTAGA